jgi:DNA-binding NarL/FixJ family response regulator
MIKEFSRFSLRVDLTKNAERLTQEEIEVVGMIADGLDKKIAADRIDKSEEAVTEILNGVIRKLRANLDIFA